MAPAKGKQGTKGAKQIKEENKQTYHFYMYIIIAANVVVMLVQFMYGYNTFRFIHIALLLFSTLLYVGCMMTMSSMGNGGLDLNMESGIGEHLKDIILVTAACQVLSSISLYFWLLWLLIPCVAFYKLWVNILGPWIFAPPPPEEEISEKKRKKMERKQQKVIYR